MKVKVSPGTCLKKERERKKFWLLMTNERLRQEIKYQTRTQQGDPYNKLSVHHP